MRRKSVFATVKRLALIVAAILAMLPVSSAGALPGAAQGATLPTAPGAGAETAASVTAQAVAQEQTIYLRVSSARTEPLAFDGAGVFEGDLVTNYQFLISVDNTGDPFADDAPGAACSPVLADGMTPNPDYPDLCDFPGIRTVPGWSPVYTQGTQNELNESVGIPLPDGKYLISVLGDGYKNDGEHFTVPMDTPLVEVRAHPLPLPPASMEIMVFNDNALTNGQHDGPSESGLAGFRVSLNDIMGEITADLFGNPLCTIYQKDVDGNVVLDGDGAPVIETIGAGCVSDETGYVTIPNIGPIRYDVLVTPPDGETWIQTTTLEGSHGWDTWLQEAGTGLDNEFLVAPEPFPWTIFGFVQPQNHLQVSAEPGSISGVIMGGVGYTPFINGLPYQGDLWDGFMGFELDRPIAYPWLSLNDLQGGDVAVWVGQGNADGSFRIDNIPPGDYFLAYWDFDQHYILDFVQVTVAPNANTDIGVRTVTNWFTQWFGTVFLDYNEDGMQDPGEPGVPDYLVVLRDRDNTEIDRMSIASVTDVNGKWSLPKGYPMGWWMVLEAYNDLYRTTGVTFQTSNQPEPTTIMGAGVDVSALPILGQWGRLDWGVKPYTEDENGGIAGTVFYDTARAEDNAAYAGAEPWQPGIPNLEVRLYASVPDGLGGFMKDPDGSFTKGPLLATTYTEDYVRPTGCQARDVNGDPVAFPLFPAAAAGKDCIETLAMGTQFGTEFAQLPGNYGFGEIDDDGDPNTPMVPIPAGDYLVEVVVPNDPVFTQPLYTVTREEDSNIFDGDEFIPLVAPPACAGPLHTVDLLGDGTDNYAPIVLPDGTTSPASTPVDNPGHVEAGGSRYEGQPMNLCNVKLINVSNGKSIAPLFQFWTEVPIPGRWRGYIIDDLKISTNPMTLFFGEKAGIPHSPMGIYDWTGELEHTVHSDAHGVYEVLLPSDATFNAPTPSGMLANMYYIYGNDPGQPGAYNVNYNPAYRSIGTTFESYPGVMVPSDLAPVQNAVGIQAPGSQFTSVPACALEDTNPQIFVVDAPNKPVRGTLTVQGLGFGAMQGNGRISLGNTWLTVNSWNDRTITATLPNSVRPGRHQLSIIADNGLSTVNGLTIHVLGQGYNPPVFEAGVGKTYSTVQSAIDAAAGQNGLVVVYPGPTTPQINPLGWWFENPVIYSPVALQGIGPGGVYADGTAVPGAVLDGRAYGGDTPYTDEWRTLMGDIWLNRGGWSGAQMDEDNLARIFEGPVVSVVAEDGEFTSAFRASIDGFTIQGGHQQGQPNNLHQIGDVVPGIAGEVLVQGGGVMVYGYARYLQITNNQIKSNGGSYGGAIRLGTPHTTPALRDNQNDYVRIANNRVLANGGSNLAGAIGVFNGADNYEIASNDICGNFTVEYGGGISHYGYSPNGSIHHNRVYYNQAYDEGGGIMIAGELQTNPMVLSPGAGPVNIYANLIQANLGNDDGGGLRFLMAGNFVYNVYNNMIVNNISTHEGGGISLNDAPQVRVFNNTIMKNITTATAMTSNGQPAPAGLSTSGNSSLLQSTLPADWPTYSDPLVFNNIFWDNRAGGRVGSGVTGIGLTGDPFPVNYWDLGVSNRPNVLNPTYSMLQVPSGSDDSTNLVGVDPLVMAPFDVSVELFPWRGNPNFVGANIVSPDVDAVITQMGNYHLTSGSAAVDAGTNRVNGVSAPNQDIDGEMRPAFGKYEIGADELPIGFPFSGVLFGGQPAAGAEAGAGVQQVYAFRTYLPLVVRSGDLSFGGDSGSFDVQPGQVDVVDSGLLYWRGAFGPDQEAYLTFLTVSDEADRQDLVLKLLGSDATARMIVAHLNAAEDEVTVQALSPGGEWTEFETFGGVAFGPGDRFGARASQGGLVELYWNDVLIGRADLTLGDSPWAFNPEGGNIGTWFDLTGLTPGGANPVFTGFGGGNLPQ